MIWYVLITTGPKPAGNLLHVKAARRQIENLRAFDWQGTELRPQIAHDYARQVKGLSSLPVLHRLLEAAAAAKGLIFLDDVGRLFARCKPQDRANLMAELTPYGPHLFSLRHRRKFGNLSTEALRTVTFREGSFQQQPRPRRQPDEIRSEQTGAGRAASLRAKRHQADASARRLHELGQALQKGEAARVTFAMIAREADRQGIPTARGGRWSSSTVARMLRRLPAGQVGHEPQ